MVLHRALRARKPCCLLSSVLCLLIPCLLTGCATQPSPVGEAAPLLPAQWHTESAALSEGESPSAGWDFGSEELRRLLAEAEAASLDVAAAVARVRQAEAAARIAGAPLLPEVTAGMEAGRQGDFDGSASTRSYGASFTTRFELDFWGGNRAQRDAALHSLTAVEFERGTTRLTVTAGVAHAWLSAVALRERIGIAEANLANAERLLVLVEARVRAGAASKLELAQQRGFVAGQRRTLARLRQEAEAARVALSLLLARPEGVEPGADTALADLRIPVIDAGLPSALLIRRPDIARAEARLAAASANVTAARAALFPNITLDAEVGASGERFRHALDHPAWSLLAGLTSPLFNAGRLAAERDLAAAEREELLADYRQTILNAFAEVELALSDAQGLEAQARAQAEELDEAERALALAESRYRAGAETLLTLLDTQRAIHDARDEAASLKLARLAATVSLGKALGGGWETATEKAAETAIDPQAKDLPGKDRP